MKTQKISRWDLEKLEEAIASAEELLKQADAGIDAMILKRGAVAQKVQHLWNVRHNLKQRMNPEDDR